MCRPRLSSRLEALLKPLPQACARSALCCFSLGFLLGRSCYSILRSSMPTRGPQCNRYGGTERYCSVPEGSKTLVESTHVCISATKADKQTHRMLRRHFFCGIYAGSSAGRRQHRVVVCRRCSPAGLMPPCSTVQALLAAMMPIASLSGSGGGTVPPPIDP